MLPRCVLFVLICHVTGTLSLPATYNQQQTGQLNVQVHVKDVQVLALLDTEQEDEYTMYDYIYDYADLTVKPSKPTTTSTTSTSLATTTETAEIPETVDSSSQNSTLSPTTSESLTANSTSENLALSTVGGGEANETSIDLVTEKLGNLSSESTMVKTRINDKTTKLLGNNDENLTERNTERFPTENVTSRATRKHCRSGYSPDGKGRCRRLTQRRLSLIPLAMKFGPKLLSDLARSTKNLAQGQVQLMHST